MSKQSVKIGVIAAGGVLLGYAVKKLLERNCCKKNNLYFVGIDLGATNAKACVVNNAGELLANSSQPLTDYSDKGVVDALVTVASEAVTNAGLSWSQIAEVGVGSPGTIDFDVCLLELFFHILQYIIVKNPALFLEWRCYQSFQLPHLGSCSFG